MLHGGCVRIGVSGRSRVATYNSRLKLYWHSYSSSSGGQRHQVLTSGSKVIIVGHTNWLGETHDLMMLDMVPQYLQDR